VGRTRSGGRQEEDFEGATDDVSKVSGRCQNRRGVVMRDQLRRSGTREPGTPMQMEKPQVEEPRGREHGSGAPFCISKQEVWEAYKRVKANKGAAGVDEQSIADFEKRLKPGPDDGWIFAVHVVKRTEGIRSDPNAEYRAIYGDAVLSTRYGFRAVPSIHIIGKKGRY
jgi:hypothetical protein